jgi:uncharacterized protein (TIGR02453 family)
MPTTPTTDHTTTGQTTTGQTTTGQTTTGQPGIPAAALTFFADLEVHNDRDWWTANVATYRELVRAPFEQLLGGLGPLVGERLDWRIYRPQRDTRFAADRSPYKTFIGAVTQRAAGTGHFVQVSRRGLLVGNGYPMLARDQLARFRAAVADDASGEDFVAAVRRSEDAGIEVTSGRWDPLKTAPRGFRRDHPRIRWLCARGVEIPRRVGAPEWLHTDGAAEQVARLLGSGREVTDWLDRYVGPSELTPEEIWGR